MDLNIEGHNLTRLIEECSEVIKIACKIQRFGSHDFNPQEHMLNIEALRLEIGDICGVLVQMGVSVKTDDPELQRMIEAKIAKIKKWSQIERKI